MDNAHITILSSSSSLPNTARLNHLAFGSGRRKEETSKRSCEKTWSRIVYFLSIRHVFSLGFAFFPWEHSTAVSNLWLRLDAVEVCSQGKMLWQGLTGYLFCFASQTSLATVGWAEVESILPTVAKELLTLGNPIFERQTAASFFSRRLSKDWS